MNDTALSQIKQFRSVLIFLSIFLLSGCVPIFIDFDDGSDRNSSESTQEDESASKKDSENDEDNAIILDGATDPKLSSFTVDQIIATEKTGFFDLHITDAPIDFIEHVYISIKTIKLKPADKLPFTFEFNEPLAIDLLELKGSKSEQVFSQLNIPLGHYTYIELGLDFTHELNNHIVRFGSQYPLTTQNKDSKIKIPVNFLVEEDGNVSITLDFDLRQSIRRLNQHHHVAKYILKPAIRVVNNHNAGHITGYVDETLLSVNDCHQATVYLYRGSNAETLDMVELGNKYIGPLLSTSVDFVDGKYQYQLGFVEFGSYTIAVTCEAFKDDIDSVDNISFIHSDNLEHHSLVTQHDHSL